MESLEQVNPALDAKMRHKILFGDGIGKGLVNLFDYYSNIVKTRYPKTYAQYFNRTAVVTKATQTLQKVIPEKFMNLARTKIGKGGLILSAGIVGWNLLSRHFSGPGPAQPAIPRKWDRGYDIIQEHMTDFGSPVKLHKAANKIITPYKSSVRRATYTTTGAILNDNVALSNSHNAINHHRY